jgi:hypothetical protein
MTILRHCSTLAAMLLATSLTAFAAPAYAAERRRAKDDRDGPRRAMADAGDAREMGEPEQRVVAERLESWFVQGWSLWELRCASFRCARRAARDTASRMMSAKGQGAVKRLLFIGHLDTVFELDSPSGQRF